MKRFPGHSDPPPPPDPPIENRNEIEKYVLLSFIAFLQNCEAMNVIHSIVQKGIIEIKFPVQIPLTSSYSQITAMYNTEKMLFISLSYKAFGKINTINLTN
jgi:hypothetical protein